MAPFNFLKKASSNNQMSIVPYKDKALSLIYNLLFCDDLNLLKQNTKEPHAYPFDVLFAENSSVADLQKIIDETNMDPRLKIFAYKQQVASGYVPDKKELLAVIVEVGLDRGLDVLASFKDGTARYLNQAEKILVWETTEDQKANELTKQLFENSQTIVDQIGAWDKPRRPHPAKGNVRISFLVSGELYFGEGPMNTLFADPMAGPALDSATKLMQYITEKALE